MKHFEMQNVINQRRYFRQSSAPISGPDFQVMPPGPERDALIEKARQNPVLHQNGQLDLGSYDHPDSPMLVARGRGDFWLTLP